MANWDRLNVRAGLGTRNPVIASLFPCRCGIVDTGQRSGCWCRVSAAGMEGWVLTRYLVNAEASHGG